MSAWWVTVSIAAALAVANYLGLKRAEHNGYLAGFKTIVSASLRNPVCRDPKETQ